MNTTIMAQQKSDGQADKDAAQRLVQAHDDAIRGLDSSRPQPMVRAVAMSSMMSPPDPHQEYMRSRQELLDKERKLDFDYRCRSRATSLEHRADRVIQYLRRQDKETVYDAAHYKKGYGGQKHKRFAGDHFLTNVDLIDQTRNEHSHRPAHAQGRTSSYSLQRMPQPQGSAKYRQVYGPHVHHERFAADGRKLPRAF